MIPHIKCLPLIIDSIEASTCTIHSFVHMNMLFRLVCSWTVQLALVTVLLGYLCDNIGLILACLPSGSTDVTASASWYITKPSGIPILSPVLFMRVGDPYIPLFKFEEFLIYLSRFLF